MIDITRVRIPASTPSARSTAENILAIAASRGRMSPPQEAQIRAMERFLTSAQIKRAGRFVSVLREVAEWGQE